MGEGGCIGFLVKDLVCYVYSNQSINDMNYYLRLLPISNSLARRNTSDQCWAQVYLGSIWRRTRSGKWAGMVTEDEIVTIMVAV